MKKKQRKLLAAILAAAMLIPQSVMTAGAADLSTVQPVYQVNDLEVTDLQDLSADVGKVSALEHGTVNIRYRMASENSELTALYSVSDSSKASTYAAFYVENNTVGLETRNGGEQINTFTADNQNVNDTSWHTLTWVFGDSSTSLYVDGNLAQTSNTTAFFSSVSGVNAMAAGGLIRSGKNWHNDCSISEITVYGEQFTADNAMEYHNSFDQSNADAAYEVRNVDLMTSGAQSDATDDLDKVSALEHGTVNIRYRMSAADSGLTALYSVSDSSAAATYAAFYVNNNRVGLELRNAGAQLNTFTADQYADGTSISINDTYWHTLTWVFGESGTSLYVDGERADTASSTAENTAFFSALTDADTMTIGGRITAGGGGNWHHACSIDEISVYEEQFTAETVELYHEVTNFVPEMGPDPETTYKTEPEALFYSGYQDSVSYRIPSLLTTTSDTVIAAIDQRHQHSADWGNIDTVLRRREAGSDTFDDAITVIDLADQESNGGNHSAFLIDPCMVQDETSGRIYLLIDMFPESTGFGAAQQGTGYTEIEGEQYLTLTDSAGNEYTVRDEGVVYNTSGEPTDYTVVTECEAPYKELGDLYQNGEKLGNIYLKTAPGAAPLTVLTTAYLWLTYSDDDGETWSQPQDLTPLVKEDWMKFIGTGPGVGIQADSGRLIFPIYYTNSYGRQSSANIYSDDGGETWYRGESPNDGRVEGSTTYTSQDSGVPEITESQIIEIQTGDHAGNLLQFMRAYGGVRIAISHDEGETWEPDVPVVITDCEPYCQLSVISYVDEEDGKEYVLLSNPSTSGRYDGTVRMGVIGENDDSVTISWGSTDGVQINWLAKRLYASGRFLYSCLTRLPDGNFASLYEMEPSSINIEYTEFDKEWILAEDIELPMDDPEVVSVSGSKDGTTLTAEVTFDQNIMVTGSPVLTLSVGDETLEAEYVSGSATDTLTFACTVDEDLFGIVTATGIKEGSGTVENIHNGVPADVTGTVVDLTKIPHSAMTATASSAHTASKEGPASLAIDDNPGTWWHTHYGAEGDGVLPQSLTIEFDQEYVIDRYAYLSRGAGGNGGVRDYELQISLDGQTWYAAAEGELKDSSDTQMITFDPVNAKYVRLVVNSSYGSDPNKHASAAEINIYRATEAVIPADKEALQAAIDAANDIREKDCASGYDTLAAALAAAKTALDDDNVPQLAVDSLTQALNDAAAAVTYKDADLEGLNSAISDYGNVDTSLLTDESAASYTEALNAAKAMQTAEDLDIRSQDEIDAAAEALESAYNALVYKAADLTALREAMEECSVEDLTLFTDASADGYGAALDAAEELADSESTLDIRNQAEIDAAAAALRNAYDALVYKPADKAGLSEAVEQYGTINTELLTEETKAVYEEALRTAQDLLANEGLDIRDQGEIDDAAAALQDAYNGIKYQEADMNALQERYDAALNVDMDSLTDESRRALESAMSDVKALLDKAEAGEIDIRDQEEIDRALDALSSALAGLEEKPADQPGVPDKPDDGKNDTKGDIPGKDKAVKTGDAAKADWIFLMLAVSMTAVVFVIRRRENVN